MKNFNSILSYTWVCSLTILLMPLLAMAQLSEDGESDSLQVPQPPHSIGDIITYNGSLEESEDGLVNQQYIPGWSFNITAQSIFEIQEEEVFHEAKALHIEFGEWDGSMNDWHMEVTNEPLYVSAGDILRLTVAMKSDREGGKGTLYFGLPESGGWQRYPEGEGFPVELTGEWKEYELEHTVSSFDAQHSMRVGVAMNFEENGGSNIWIDHLRVEKIGETDPTDPGEVISIAEAREMPMGSEVTIEGVITRAQGSFTYLQDSTGGMVIRQTEESNPDWYFMVQDGELREGDRLQVTGITSEYASLKQINERDLHEYHLLSRNNPLPEPRLMTLQHIADEGYTRQAQLIRVENLSLLTGDDLFYHQTTYEITDESQDDGSVTLRINWEQDQPIAGTRLYDEPYHFEGILSQFSFENPYSGFQLLPIYPEDMTPAASDTTVPGTHNVTFEVDMSGVEHFDPELHELYITGSMMGWAMPGSEPDARLEQAGADIYRITLPLEEEYYEYKYFLVEDEPTWNMGEWGGESNRELMVTGDILLTDVFGVQPEPEGRRDITFRVDMSYQIENGVFDPARGDSVQVRGDFTQWNIQPVSMTHEGDHVYATTISVPGQEGEMAEYKFAITAGDDRLLPNGGWEFLDPDDLGLNRSLELGAEDVLMTLPDVFFSNMQETHPEVQVRMLNTYDQLRMEDEIPMHPFAELPVSFEAVIVSHPKNSGLAAYDTDTGQIGRIHVFVVDTDAFESGKEGMYMQLVAEGAVMDDLAERSRGDVIRVEGNLTFFGLMAQFVPETVTHTGMVGEGIYSDYHELLEPDTVDISALNNISEWGGAGLNVHTYPDLVNRYVRIENAPVAISEPADDGRPQMVIGRDANSAYMRDYSLRFRNDRQEYLEGFNRRRIEDGPFIPPPEGSELEISGFLTVQEFDDFGLFHGASFSIAPWDDGVIWETLEDGSVVRTEPEGWPVDLQVTGEPLPIPRPPHEPGDNLVFNGSFEENQAGPADPGEVPAWWFNMTDESVFEFVEDAHHGDIALNIEFGPWNGIDEDWHVEVVNEPIFPAEGDVIRVSVWMKADTDQRASHLYLGLPQSGGWQRYPVSEDSLIGGLNVNLTTEWQEYVIEHTVSASDARDYMRFGIAMNLEENDGGRIWIDNLEVIKVDEAPMREVVFSVDMDHHLREGIFQPHTGDFVELRGTMTGWLDAPVRMERMASETDSSEVSTIYSAQVGIPGYEGDEQQYKFAMVAGDGRPLPDEGWEGEVGAGEHGNRILVLGPAGEVQTLPTELFNEGEIAEPPVVEDHFLNLLIADANDNSIELTGGVHPDATDGYDEEFDLYAPPLPPSGSFDARILVEDDGQTEHFLRHIRPDTLYKTVWNIKVQPSSGGMPVRVTWTPPALPAEEILQIQDHEGRAILNMVQHEVWEITEPGHLQFQVVHMTGGQREVQWNANWNLVGMPVQAGHTHFQELFPGGLSGTLFGFDGAYVSREVMNPGRGYWLRFNEGGAATLAGAHVASVDVHLQEGWNLISGPSFEVPVDAVADPDGVILSGTLYGFDGAYVPASQLMPGSGYWIRASASAEVTMGEEEPVNGKRKTPSEALTNARPEDPDTESFDRLLVSDESGHTRELLFAGHLEEEVNELRFSLPPEPPGDAFDVRFAGDRYLVTESAGTITAIAPGELTLKLVLSKSSVDRAYRFAVSVDDEMVETVELADKQEYTISSAGRPVTLKMTTDEKSSVAELPVVFALSQNYPNPFNPETLIRYSLPEEVHVNLAVYNLLGQRVAVLMNDEQAPGHHEVMFDASRLSSGIYIYRLQAGNYTSTKQMTLIK